MLLRLGFRWNSGSRGGKPIAAHLASTGRPTRRLAILTVLITRDEIAAGSSPPIGALLGTRARANNGMHLSMWAGSLCGTPAALGLGPQGMPSDAPRGKRLVIGPWRPTRCEGRVRHKGDGTSAS